MFVNIISKVAVRILFRWKRGLCWRSTTFSKFCSKFALVAAGKRPFSPLFPRENSIPRERKLPTKTPRNILPMNRKNNIYRKNSRMTGDTYPASREHGWFWGNIEEFYIKKVFNLLKRDAKQRKSQTMFDPIWPRMTSHDLLCSEVTFSCAIITR